MFDRAISWMLAKKESIQTKEFIDNYWSEMEKYNYYSQTAEQTPAEAEGFWEVWTANRMAVCNLSMCEGLEIDQDGGKVTVTAIGRRRSYTLFEEKYMTDEEKEDLIRKARQYIWELMDGEDYDTDDEDVEDEEEEDVEEDSQS